MSVYSMTRDEKGVTITQTRLWLLAFGAAFILGSSFFLYLWWRDRSTLTGVESPLVLLVCLGVMCGGVWALIQPYSFSAQFDTVSGRFLATWQGLGGVSRPSHPFAHLRTIAVKETDNDGYWYTPQIRLDDGGVIDLGFGDSTRERAEDLVNQLLPLVTTADNRHRPT